MKRCAACDSLITRDHLLCHSCWMLLPPDIRDDLGLKHPGNPVYDAAVRYAREFFSQPRSRTGERRPAPTGRRRTG